MFFFLAHVTDADMRPSYDWDRKSGWKR